MRVIDYSSFKAFLFDMDGTMLDSMGVWYQIDIAFCRRHGIVMPPALQREIEGFSFYQTACYFKERFHMAQTPEALMAEWNEMAMEAYSSSILLKPMVREFLEQTARRGILLGIATSNSMELAHAALKAHKLEPLFSCVLTAKEVPNGKPAPDIYLRLAQRLGVSPKECIVFEDVPAGILAGKRAGMTTVAVEDSYSHAVRDEKRRLADYFIDTYEELMIGDTE